MNEISPYLQNSLECSVKNRSLNGEDIWPLWYPQKVSIVWVPQYLLKFFFENYKKPARLLQYFLSKIQVFNSNLQSNSTVGVVSARQMEKNLTWLSSMGYQAIYLFFAGNFTPPFLNFESVFCAFLVLSWSHVKLGWNKTFKTVFCRWKK